MDTDLAPFCPRYRRAIEIIGQRWTGAILRILLTGETRFGRIAAGVPGLSDRLLSERLKALEAEGLLVREVTPDTPVHIEYHLTAKGRSLTSVVHAVAAWAEEWLPEEGAGPRADRRPTGPGTAAPGPGIP